MTFFKNLFKKKETNEKKKIIKKILHKREDEIAEILLNTIDQLNILKNMSLQDLLETEIFDRNPETLKIVSLGIEAILGWNNRKSLLPKRYQALKKYNSGCTYCGTTTNLIDINGLKICKECLLTLNDDEPLIYSKEKK